MAKDIEKALADLNIVFGINKKIIENIVWEVAATGTARNKVGSSMLIPRKNKFLSFHFIRL